MVAALGDRDSVQGAVELAVAAAVVPVALVFAAAGVEGCDAGVAGELGVAWEAADGADLAEQLGGAERPAARELERAPSDRARARLEVAVELADRTGQAAAAAEEVTGDPHLRRLLQTGEPAADPVEPHGPVERSQRHLQGRVELVQVASATRTSYGLQACFP